MHFTLRHHVRSELSGDDLYSLLLMMAAAETDEIVLVEDDSDAIVYTRVIDENRAQIVPGYGKATVEFAMDRVVEQNGPARVLAILDRDFVGMGTPPHQSADVIYTALYDLEAELLAVEDLARRLASAHSKADAWRQVRDIGGVPMFDWLVSNCAPLGALRLISVRNAYGLRLRNFPMHEFIAVPGGANVDRLCELAVQRGGASVLIPGDLRSQVEATLSRTSNPLDLCSGHDLFAALSLLVRTTWGGDASSDTLERTARAAANEQHVSQTGVYQHIVAWQDASGRVVTAL